MQSVMNHNFSQIPGPQLERSTFERNFAHKTTFNAGELIPFYHDEILPGDTVNLKSTILARLQSLIFPVMDNVFIDLFFFFVPYRLLWDNWETFITGNDGTPGAQTEYLMPTIEGVAETVTIDENTLGDYLGIPTQVDFYAGDTSISAMPFRAYHLIWNEWFRDESLQEEVVFATDDGPDDLTDYTAVLKRGKRKDYITSCLPWPQKGTAISLPLGTSAPVIGDGTALKLFDGTDNLWVNYNNDIGTGIMGVTLSSAAVGAAPAGSVPLNDKVIGASQTDPSGLIANLSAATAATVQQLREAFAFQQILELDARSGSRYTEYLQGTWGQRPEDYRLQRPEYLGGSSRPIQITAVQQTSGTPAVVSLDPGQTPQGNLSAHAQGSSQAGFQKSFVEHGIVMGMVNVRSDITYQQGLHRSWTRQTRFEFPHPALMHLGEQAVLNQEVCSTSVSATNIATFGYQERWAEFRYKQSYVSGAFRSNAAAPLDAWHLALDFASVPTLGDTFIQDDPPLDRVIAVPDEPQIIMDSFSKISHTRAMPTFSVPGLMGRF